MKSNQEGWMHKQLQKIPIPDNPIKLWSSLDVKSKVLKMDIA